jgi:hypothetical protein
MSYETSGALHHMQLADIKYQCSIRHLMSHGITEVSLIYDMIGYLFTAIGFPHGDSG